MPADSPSSSTATSWRSPEDAATERTCGHASSSAASATRAPATRLSTATSAHRQPGPPRRATWGSMGGEVAPQRVMHEALDTLQHIEVLIKRQLGLEVRARVPCKGPDGKSGSSSFPLPRHLTPSLFSPPQPRRTPRRFGCLIMTTSCCASTRASWRRCRRRCRSWPSPRMARQHAHTPAHWLRWLSNSPTPQRSSGRRPLHHGGVRARRQREGPARRCRRGLRAHAEGAVCRSASRGPRQWWVLRRPRLWERGQR